MDKLRKRVEHAIRIAKDVHGKKLLQDQYPTSYMPHVGRQVMQGGGMPEDVVEPTVYDEMGNVLIPAQRRASENQDYRQPLGERVREGISKGFGEHRLGMSPENQAKYDPTGIVQNLFAAPADAFLRAPGAVIGGASALGAGLYGMLPGVDETQTNKLQRDLRVLGDVGMIEAGNVRPRAPSDVSSIPRSGELLPPEPTQRALQIAKERPTLTQEPWTALDQALPDMMKPGETVGEAKQRLLEPPAAPVETPTAPVERPTATVEAPTPPQYERKVSDMGLYSHAAEVAAQAKQAGRPEDLINWLKRQPGVKLEELREAGAVKKDGSYDPNFAPDIKKMTPQELSDRLHGAVPEVSDVVRYEKQQVPFETVDELKQLLIDNPSAWRNYMPPSEPGWNFFADNTERAMYLDSQVDHLNGLMRNMGGKFNIPGDAQYSPSVFPELSTSGGTNYREIPLSLGQYPEGGAPLYQVTGSLGDGTTFKTLEEAQAHIDGIRSRADEVFANDPAQRAIVERYLERTGIIEVQDPSAPSRNIESYGHMKDVPNNVAWLRVQDVPHPSGEGKTLRVEETQSDIAQKNREGFRMSPDELAAKQSEIDAKEVEYNRINEELNERFNTWLKGSNSSTWRKFTLDNPEVNDIIKQRDQLEMEIEEGVNNIRRNSTALPRIAYVGDTKQWTDLTIKRALLEAARGDYKSMQVITGDINRKRYEGYDPEEGDAGYHYDVNIPSSLKRVLKNIDPNAKVEMVEQAPELTDAYKRAIEKFDNRIEETSQRRIRVLERAKRAEAEGDEAEYRRLMEYIDDYDSEIESYTSRRDKILAPQKFWSVEITPKMREKTLQGLPRFKRGGRVRYASGGVVQMSVDDLRKALEI